MLNEVERRRSLTHFLHSDIPDFHRVPPTLWLIQATSLLQAMFILHSVQYAVNIFAPKSTLAITIAMLWSAERALFSRDCCYCEPRRIVSEVKRRVRAKAVMGRLPLLLEGDFFSRANVSYCSCAVLYLKRVESKVCCSWFVQQVWSFITNRDISLFILHSLTLWRHFVSISFHNNWFKLGMEILIIWKKTHWVGMEVLIRGEMNHFRGLRIQQSRGGRGFRCGWLTRWDTSPCPHLRRSMFCVPWADILPIFLFSFFWKGKIFFKKTAIIKISNSCFTPPLSPLKGSPSFFLFSDREIAPFQLLIYTISSFSPA